MSVEHTSPATPAERPKEAAFHPYPFWSPRFWHGMTLGVWLKLLWRNKFRVAWQRWPMAVAITLVSVFNTLLAWVQALALAGRISDAMTIRAPIFIIGHWRSGTTHLHEILVHDRRFGYPTTYECYAPSHFLASEWMTPLLKFLLPAKRPMDNMTAGWEHPQEDEFALCNLGVGSPYAFIAFPNQPSSEERFLDLQGLSARELSRWKRGLNWFLLRVSAKHKKTLVLKSPPHTARIRVLLELFPDAKFIHIVRDPAAVFPSTMRLWKSLFTLQGLQIPDFEGLEEQVLRGFVRMYEQFDQDRPLLNAENFHELRYEDLVRDPLGELEKLYANLQLGEFAEVRAAVAAYLETQKSYQTNRHVLTPELRQKLERHWGPWIERYGYSVNPVEQNKQNSEIGSTTFTMP